MEHWAKMVKTHAEQNRTVMVLLCLRNRFGILLTKKERICF